MRNTHYIVAGLSDADMIWLLSMGKLRNLAAGETLVAIGRPVADLFFVTRGTFNGDAMAGGSGATEAPLGAVTLTGTTTAGCDATNTTGTKPHSACNQGVGNGPEGCDPGNSNQGNPSRSNDERGGKPGSPGRKG